jgi:hypothetical protein
VIVIKRETVKKVLKKALPKSFLVDALPKSLLVEALPKDLLLYLAAARKRFLPHPCPKACHSLDLHVPGSSISKGRRRCLGIAPPGWFAWKLVRRTTP